MHKYPNQNSEAVARNTLTCPLPALLMKHFSQRLPQVPSDSSPPAGQLQGLTLLWYSLEGFPLPPLLLPNMVSCSLCYERTTKQLAKQRSSHGTCKLLHLEEERATWRLCPGCLLSPHTCWDQKDRIRQRMRGPTSDGGRLGRSHTYKSKDYHSLNCRVQGCSST